MNVLGRLLMELRQELQREPKDALMVVAPPKIPNFLFLGKGVDAVGPRGNESAQFQPSMFG
jgi:hypothetical protein